MSAIQFTDRYGGNPPSWLRACHGQCEATGYVPRRAHSSLEPCGDSSGKWLDEDGHCDGWHFERCEDCGGTGRAPWSATLARLPRWLALGAAGLALLLPLAARADEPAAPGLKGALLQAFVQYVVPVLFTGLAGLIGWALVALRRRLEAQAGESRLAKVGLAATTVIDSVVADLEVSLKPELAEATKDGELTKAEIEHLRRVALERVKRTLGEKGLSELAGVLGIAGGAVDQLLQGLIERSVARVGEPAASPQ